MSAKKIVTFFSLFVIIVFSIFYITARNEFRKEYHFVILRYDEKPNNITFSDNYSKLLLSKFDPRIKNIEKEDSLEKKAFSEKVYIYKKNKRTDKYFLAFVIKNPKMFPVSWLK
jgi:ribosomal protein L33